MLFVWGASQIVSKRVSDGKLDLGLAATIEQAAGNFYPANGDAVTEMQIESL